VHRSTSHSYPDPDLCVKHPRWSRTSLEGPYHLARSNENASTRSHIHGNNRNRIASACHAQREQERHSPPMIIADCPWRIECGTVRNDR
jgi:hypothetical protein